MKERFDAFWIVQGRLLDWGPLPAQSELVERTQAACARRRGQEPVPVDEVDEVRIVASWIADHQPAELSLEAAPGSERIAAFVREQADSQTGGRPRPRRSMPAAVSRIDAGV